ncbi:centrosomal protein of 44 kDa isoform X3 [Otolemur garnettii]|uniref:centrosomal protein of 44 kDa isoform X3 n=1 Tax=Otolemur garnettii TaxID=30611 RepID=UPI000C7F6D53|nr:centrosomal protein of 44 kDa isoform X3 [Otolemur garnettii]
MATGDLKRSLRNLEQVLRLLNYPEEVDCAGLVKGDTAASLPIISYSFTSYSPYVTELIMESNIELIAKNDLRFIDAVYKTLSQQRKKSSSSKSEPLNNEKIPAEAIGVNITGRFLTSGKKKAVVIRHLYNEDSVNRPEDIGISTVTGVNEAVAVSDLKPAEIRIPEVKGPEIKAEQQEIKVSPEIIILQTMLAECQEKLKKLTWIEKRLEYLEENMKGKVMVNEKTWTHLLSRITLLETEMLLSKKTDGCIEFNEMSEDCTSCSDMDLLNPDRNIKGERPVSIPLSSGYSSVSTDSTPRASTIHYCLNEISQVRNTGSCLDNFLSKVRKTSLSFGCIYVSKKIATLYKS